MDKTFTLQWLPLAGHIKGGKNLSSHLSEPPLCLSPPRARKQPANFQADGDNAVLGLTCCLSVSSLVVQLLDRVAAH